MRVSGFTFVRDAVRLGYPILPAVRSILPLVDELVVNVGASPDGTLDLVRSLDDPRLVVLESRWDEGQLERGQVLAHQTDLALGRCTGDVCLYVQADEALHEDDHPAVREALRRLHAEPGLEGLVFDYVHFYGSFHTVGVSRRWYRREIRAVKNRAGVRSWRDAQGFRVGPGEGARKLRVAPAGGRMFHYGWVRPPEAQKVKLAEFERLYHGDAARERRLAAGFRYDVGEKVRPFRGTHPAPMRDWIAREDWAFEPRPALLRRGHLREDLLDLVEAATGVRIGEYRNYELVR
ncbi:MAG TPA: glycosyltransferase [Anaeromyxobacteraceae bacterium]